MHLFFRYACYLPYVSIFNISVFEAGSLAQHFPLICNWTLAYAMENPTMCPLSLHRILNFIKMILGPGRVLAKHAAGYEANIRVLGLNAILFRLPGRY